MRCSRRRLLRLRAAPLAAPSQRPRAPLQAGLHRKKTQGKMEPLPAAAAVTTNNVAGTKRSATEALAMSEADIARTLYETEGEKYL